MMTDAPGPRGAEGVWGERFPPRSGGLRGSSPRTDTARVPPIGTAQLETVQINVH